MLASYNKAEQWFEFDKNYVLKMGMETFYYFANNPVQSYQLECLGDSPCHERYIPDSWITSLQWGLLSAEYGCPICLWGLNENKRGLPKVHGRP